MAALVGKNPKSLYTAWWKIAENKNGRHKVKFHQRSLKTCIHYLIYLLFGEDREM